MDEFICLNENVLICHPFSDSNDTGDEIQRVKLQGLVDMGISDQTSTVWEHMHG